MEQWKDIEWYEGLYQISNLGRVKSFHNGKWWLWKWKILKPFKKSWWYLQIYLWDCKWRKIFMIHRLIAIHFISNPFNLPCVCHKDETLDEDWCLYNGKDNLFWWTTSDNMIDKCKKWRWSNYFTLNNPMKWKIWGEHNCSKKVNQYTIEWIFIKTWDSLMDIERELWIRNQNISGCCRGIKKTAGWFIWKYN